MSRPALFSAPVLPRPPSPASPRRVITACRGASHIAERPGERVSAARASVARGRATTGCAVSDVYCVRACVRACVRTYPPLFPGSPVTFGIPTRGSTGASFCQSFSFVFFCFSFPLFLYLYAGFFLLALLLDRSIVPDCVRALCTIRWKT